MLNITEKLYKYITYYPESFFKIVFNEFIWFMKKHSTSDPYTIKKVLGSDMFLDLRNKGISHQLAVHGVREIPSVIIFLHTLKKGERLLDLGSNIGYYTLLGSRKVGKGGKVYALEPDKRNFELLKKNVKLNNLDNVEIFDYAVSDKTGTTDFILSERSNVNTIDKGTIIPSKEDKIVKVNTISLDDFCDRLGEFDYMRMDIEGSEIEVFNGMSNVLSRDSPSKILFETHPHYYNESRDIAPCLRVLFKHGFKTKYIETSGDSNLEEFVEKGYRIKKIIKTDFFFRAIIENLSEEDTIHFSNKKNPKFIRSIYMER